MATLPSEIRTEKRDSFIFLCKYRIYFICTSFYNSCSSFFVKFPPYEMTHDNFALISLEKLIFININLVLSDMKYIAYD